MSFRTSLVAAVAATVLGGSLIAASPVQAADGVTLNGAGSTFIMNYIDACKAGYNASTGNNVNYTGGGSGAGKAAFKNGTVDFAMADSLVKPADEASFPWAYVTVIAGPIAVAFNLPGIASLNLGSDTFAKIMAGQIKTWNDPAIVADNKGTSKTTTVPVVAFKMVPKKVKGKVVKKNGKIVMIKQKVTAYKTKTETIGAVKLPSLPISVY